MASQNVGCFVRLDTESLMSTLDDQINKYEETVVAISQENLRKTNKTLLFYDNQFQVHDMVKGNDLFTIVYFSDV